MHNRDTHSWRPGCRFDHRPKLMGERLDQAGSEAALTGAPATLLSNTIVRDGKGPIRAVGFIADGHRVRCAGMRKGMFERVDKKFGDDQPEADRLSGSHCAILSDHLEHVGTAFTKHGTGKRGT